MAKAKTQRNSSRSENKSSENKGKKGGMRMAPVAAGVAGAALGAAAGVAAASTLSNRDTRQAVGKRLAGIRDMAMDTLDEVTRESEKGGSSKERTTKRMPSKTKH